MFADDDSRIAPSGTIVVNEGYPPARSDLPRQCPCWDDDAVRRGYFDAWAEGVEVGLARDRRILQHQDCLDDTSCARCTLGMTNVVLDASQEQIVLPFRLTEGGANTLEFDRVSNGGTYT